MHFFSVYKVYIHLHRASYLSLPYLFTTPYQTTSRSATSAHPKVSTAAPIKKAERSESCLEKRTRHLRMGTGTLPNAARGPLNG